MLAFAFLTALPSRTPRQRAAAELVWERYHHAPDSDGAGLGLALVKEMVLAMGGTVGVVSAPGQGSCFSFTLPRVR